MYLEKSSSPLDGPTFAKVFAAAVCRRVGPGKGIAVKELAMHMGVSEQTVWTWMAGNSEPKGRHLCRLMRLFDDGFTNEILGAPNRQFTSATDQRTVDALRRFHAAQRDLMDALDGKEAAE